MTTNGGLPAEQSLVEDAGEGVEQTRVQHLFAPGAVGRPG
jgi:hypothetical protein